MACESDTSSEREYLRKEASKVLLSYQDSVDDQLAETLEFIGIGVDASTQVFVVILH